jgi:hypothetical protein
MAIIPFYLDRPRNLRMRVRSSSRVPLKVEIVPNLNPLVLEFMSESISVTGGQGPKVFTVLQGTLPTGLTLNSSTGVISGTPIAVGTASIIVRITDNSGFIDTNEFTILVSAESVGEFMFIVANTATNSAGVSLTWDTTPVTTIEVPQNTDVDANICYIAKYAPDLVPAWIAHAKGSVAADNYVTAHGVTAAQDGGCFVLGNINLSSGVISPTIQWINADGTDGPSILFTTASSFGTCSWVGRLDSEGNWLWVRGICSQTGNGQTTSQQNRNVFVGCDSTDRTNHAGIALNSAGNVVFGLSVRGLNNDVISILNPTATMFTFTDVSSASEARGLMVALDPLTGDIVTVTTIATPTSAATGTKGFLGFNGSKSIRSGRYGYATSFQAVASGGTGIANFGPVATRSLSDISQVTSATTQQMRVGFTGITNEAGTENIFTGALQSPLFPATVNRDIRTTCIDIAPDGSFCGSGVTVSSSPTAQQLQAYGDGFVNPTAVLNTFAAVNTLETPPWYARWAADGSVTWLKGILQNGVYRSNTTVHRLVYDQAGSLFFSARGGSTSISIILDNGLPTQTTLSNNNSLTASTQGFVARLNPLTGDLIWVQRLQSRSAASTVNSSSPLSCVMTPYGNNKLFCATVLGSTSPQRIVIDPGSNISSPTTIVNPTAVLGYASLFTLLNETGEVSGPTRTMPDSFAGGSYAVTITACCASLL